MHACSLVLTTVFLAGVGAPLPEANQPAPEWTTDLNKMKLPQAPIVGKIFGVDFNLKTVDLEKSGALVLKDGPNTIFVFLPIKFGQGLENKSWEFPATPMPGKATPAVHVHVHQPIVKAEAFGEGCAVKIEFGKEQDSKVPGKLYICLPDPAKSYFAGSFTVELK